MDIPDDDAHLTHHDASVDNLVEDLSKLNETEELDSIIIHYQDNSSENSFNGSELTISSYSKDNDSISTPCLLSETDSRSILSEMDSISWTDLSRSTTTTVLTDNQSNNILPKSFMQLQGISVGNFNMACNFNILAALHIMTRYKLHILAIQEHTPWNREL
jgi:hypothetical protein